MCKARVSPACLLPSFISVPVPLFSRANSRITHLPRLDKFDLPIASLSTPSSRRSFLSLALALILPQPALALPPPITYSQLDISLSYPSSWFRSVRQNSLVLNYLPDVIAAVVSRTEIAVDDTSDPFGIAYDLLRDRIEKEGEDIALREASWGADSALRFAFRVLLSRPNGDVVERNGIGKALPSGAVVIITVPKEKWKALKPMVNEIVESMADAN